MMTSSNGIIFRVSGPLCGEFTGDLWIPLTNARGALMLSLIWAWTNNRYAGDLRRHHAHSDVTVMVIADGNTRFHTESNSGRSQTFASISNGLHLFVYPETQYIRLQVAVHFTYAVWLTMCRTHLSERFSTRLRHFSSDTNESVTKVTLWPGSAVLHKHVFGTISAANTDCLGFRRRTVC